MKKRFILIIIMSFLGIVHAFAQIDSVLYGISRNTSGQLYLAKANTFTGQVTSISAAAFSTGCAADGLACIDTYRNIFYLFSNGLMGIDLSSGNVVSTTYLTTPPDKPYFKLMQFNTRDSTIYGIGGSSTGQTYLSKIDFGTGQITSISAFPFSQGLGISSLACLDPFGNVFYVESAGKLIGVDLTSGNIVSDPPLTFPTSLPYFDLMQFNCRDSTIYGITRSTGGPFYFAKINPSTGLVTKISTAAVSSGYLWDALATIDPIQNIYYLQSAGKIIGIDITSGNIATQPHLVPASPTLPYFNFMRFNTSLCNNSIPKSISAHIGEVHVFPNPFSQFITFDFENPNKEEYNLLIYNSFGQLAYSIERITSEQIKIEKSILISGIYIFQLKKGKQVISTGRILVEE